MAELQRRRVAALRYDPSNDDVPQLVASGEGRHAERILEMAHELGIPVREDPLLAQALAQLTAGVDVPPELYVAVAQALVWAWESDRQAEKMASARAAGNSLS